MGENNLLNLYMDYVESYFLSFDKLYNSKDKLDFYYVLGMTYTTFMELCIKFCILNYDGYLEDYTINDFKIGNHDILQLIDNSQTKSEFLDCGISEKEFDILVVQIKDIYNLLKNDTLSFSFRYPCDKNNKIYLEEIDKQQKSIILNYMWENMIYMYNLLLKHCNGVVNSIKKTLKVIDKKIKRFK